MFVPLADRATDGAEAPVDAIVRIAFDSEEAMREALQNPACPAAVERRSRYLPDTSVGVHAAAVEHAVRLV